MTHFPLLSRPRPWSLATGRARHPHLSCDKCKCLERKKGLEKPIYSILRTNEIEINLFEGAQNLNQMRAEFIEACCLRVISPNGSSPVHQPWLGRLVEPTRRQRPSPLLSSEPRMGVQRKGSLCLRSSRRRGAGTMTPEPALQPGHWGKLGQTTPPPTLPGA